MLAGVLTVRSIDGVDQVFDVDVAYRTGRAVVQSLGTVGATAACRSAVAAGGSAEGATGASPSTEKPGER